MGGYNYNFSSIATGYGNETPRETNYVQLSPLLCCGSSSLLSGGNSAFGSSIEFLCILFGKVMNRLKVLVLKVLTRIKKVIAI